MLPHGIEVKNLTKSNPSNTLPAWVKDACEERGYGDATTPLSLLITEEDIEHAFEEAKQGNGAACVMAQAGTRLGARRVYFYRFTAWADFGSGPLVRYQTSKDIWTHVIVPFDKGHKKSVRPGLYHLTPPKSSMSLERRRKQNARRGERKPGRKSTNPRPYMGRVVMAAQLTA